MDSILVREFINDSVIDDMMDSVIATMKFMSDKAITPEDRIVCLNLKTALVKDTIHIIGVAGVLLGKRRDVTSCDEVIKAVIRKFADKAKVDISKIYN